MLSGLMFLLLAQAASHTAATPGYLTDDDKIVCKLTMEAGSKIAIRACRTQKEWEQISKDAQNDITSSRNSKTACAQVMGCF